VTAIQSELAEDIGDVTRQVWESVLDIEAFPSPGSAAAVTLGVSSCVQILGGWNGVVNLSMPSELATLIATTMFDLPAADLSDDEVDDAVGEMANMIGGNVKSLLPGPSQLSMPAVTVGTAHFPGAEVVDHLEFVVEGHPFTVTVLERGAE
jgi:chemotaxis protein CheX